MKNSIKAGLLTIILAATGVLSASAQDVTQISKRKSLSFDKETEPLEMIIKIDSDYNLLRINLDLNLFVGSAKCEILDAKGKVQGKFNIETENSTSNGKQTTKTNAANGSLQKTFRNPISGDWKIKITTVKYRVIWFIFLLPDSPSFCNLWK